MTRALDTGIPVCDECHQLNHADEDEYPRCSRCGAVLHTRHPNSLTCAWALLITAAILYILASLSPIMTIDLFGNGMPATIMEGVVELMHVDMFPIALMVFIASILVPVFKLVGIILLLYSVQRHQPMSAHQRILVHCFIERTGRWSMLDIFVVVILMVLVNFGNLASIEANLGTAASASAVVLIVLAAVTFDPRLIWDNTSLDDGNE